MEDDLGKPEKSTSIAASFSRLNNTLINLTVLITYIDLENFF